MIYLCMCRAFMMVYLLCYVYVLLHFVVCVIGLFVVVLLLVNRAFEPFEGSYIARTSWMWVCPIVVVMPSVTRPLVFS